LQQDPAHLSPEDLAGVLSAGLQQVRTQPGLGSFFIVLLFLSSQQDLEQPEASGFATGVIELLFAARVSSRSAEQQTSEQP
jgi:hypothetical protein